MATLPAYSPEIPYLGLIPAGFRHGSMIRINGTMPYGGNRFTINLQTGAALRPRDDTALHLSVRPTDPVIGRNHYENKNWGTEERYGGCPINPGQPFEILILAESAAFKIAINGIHFCQFTHRLSMERVSFVAVEGDITVTSITQNSDSAPVPPIPPVMPVYPPSYPVPYPGHPHHPHRPYLPHHPHHPHYPHHPPGSHNPGFVPGPPPPPPYTVTPYPGHRHPYIQPRDETATPAYSLDNDQNYLRRQKRNNAIKYAAAAAGIGGGVGLTAFALSRGLGGGDNDGGEVDGGDVDDGGVE